MLHACWCGAPRRTSTPSDLPRSPIGGAGAGVRGIDSSGSRICKKATSKSPPPLPKWEMSSYSTSSRVTPSNSRMKSAPYAFEGVWNPAGAWPASARSAIASAVIVVRV